MKKEIIVRKIKKGEEKEVLKLARRAFLGIEALSVSKPDNAMVALIDDKIVGGIIYKVIKCDKKKIAYISDAFVDKDSHNQGIGKKLYKETIDFLKKEFDGVTALVKDDNVASFKLLMDNGLKRVSFTEVIINLGLVNAIKHYFTTPFFIAVGMDFYMFMKDEDVKEKDSQLSDLALFFTINLLLAIPIWVGLSRNSTTLNTTFLAYLTVLAIFVLTRYLGFLSTKEKGKFRINNGGMLVNLIVNLFGFPYMINGNWYPEKYKDEKEFKEKLARPELIKWFIFLFLPFLYFTSSPYLKEVAQISFAYLIFFIIPFYPFNYFGGGRIYRYSKRIWLITFIMTAIVLFMMFKVTLI